MWKWQQSFQLATLATENKVRFLLQQYFNINEFIDLHTYSFDSHTFKNMNAHCRWAYRSIIKLVIAKCVIAVPPNEKAGSQAAERVTIKSWRCTSER